MIGKILSMFISMLDTKAVKELRQQKTDLTGLVVMAKTAEADEVKNLRTVLQEASVSAKYRPSAAAEGMGWKRYG